MLTRYESSACFNRHCFSAYKKMMDIGGNSGEFALGACRENATLTATVVDLPVVCTVGEQHVATAPESERIQFHRRTEPSGPLPEGFDLITFKSMLHDWPDAEATELIVAATNSLETDGTLLIYERCAFNLESIDVSYSALPLLLFFRSFRLPDWYAGILETLGYTDMSIEIVQLDLPFMLITARKSHVPLTEWNTQRAKD